MPTMPDRPRVALLVIDMQRGVVAEAHNRDAVVAHIAALVDRARAEAVPVVWVQHSDEELVFGSAEWEYVTQLSRNADEPLVHKSYGDSFEETELETILAARGVGRLMVTGAQTDACIRSTLHGALVRGYDTVLVEDAHTTVDLRQLGSPIGAAEAVAYTNLYWRFSGAPGRVAHTVPTEGVEFAPLG
ncbi:Nicotinamidase-related amidase [Actinopolyspora mzabensis]|uniref:Nicotinamidase-related amidase n=1 Tax=Actinopolyspora mzabensis TaxID=995066 RepID=A0A1G8Y8U3_ACTMZ|nr:isochorismatase family protein [Actinopolyspora mzabensis]SDJ99083.1 Nicotinamidase-related amidase [Actinopolyspora mzabensis]